MGREVKIFRITGMMHLYRLGEWRKFVIEVPALKKEHAIDKVLSELGSRHKLKRRHIRLLKVEEIKEDDVTKPFVKELLALDRIIVD